MISLFDLFASFVDFFTWFKSDEKYVKDFEVTTFRRT